MGDTVVAMVDTAEEMATARVDTVVATAQVAMVDTAEEVEETTVMATARVATVVATARVAMVVMVVTMEDTHIKGIRGTDEIDDERFLHTRTYTIHSIYAR